MKLILKEFSSTFLFLFLAVGVSAFSGSSIGMLGTALGFGVALFVSKIFIGTSYLVSSNPAISLGQLISGHMSVNDFGRAVLGQIIGSIAAVFSVMILVNGTSLGGVEFTGLAENGYGLRSSISVPMIEVIVVEVVLSAFFVFLMLNSQKRKDSQLLSAAIEGLTFFILYLFLIPIDGGGLNPAKSLATAIFYGTSALSQVWVFVLAPLVGGAIAGILMRVVARRSKVTKK